MNFIKNKIFIFLKASKLHPCDVLAVLLCGISFFSWYIILNIKYHQFGYYDWDLALYSHAMWNLSQGTPNSSLFGTNFWANHANYTALALVPFYKIFPHPLTLITFKIFSHVFGGYLLYRIAKDSVGGLMANIFLLLYFCFPANIFMLLHEFDFESLSIALIFLVFYCHTKDNYIGFLVSLVLLSFVKENMPFVVSAFGVYFLIFRRTEKLKWGGTALLIGASALILVFKFLTPWARTELNYGQNAYLGMYAQLGKTPQDIIIGLLRQPAILFSNLTTPNNLKYMIDLFGPFAMYSILSPHVLIPAAPIILQNTLSSVWTMHTIFYHYTSAIIPLIFLSSVNSFKILKEIMRPTSIILLTVLLVLSSYFHLRIFTPRIIDKIAIWEDRYDGLRREMLSLIPKDKPAIATFAFLNELSRRKDLYTFYDIYHGRRIFTHGDVATIGQISDYALIDFTDPWIHNEPNADRTVIHARVHQFFSAYPWSVKRAADNIVLLKKSADGPQLLQRSLEIPATSRPADLLFSIDDGVFKLKSFRAEIPEKNDTVLPLTFRWTATNDVMQHYFIRIGLLKDGKSVAVVEHSIGYSIYPTFLWKKGEVIDEKFWLYTPPLASGDYQIAVSIFNADSNTIAQLSDSGSEKNKNNIFTLETIRIE